MQGAVVRGDSNQKKVALIFTADEAAEGLPLIRQILKDECVKGSFFFTGRLYRNKKFTKDIKNLVRDSHYLGPHSDQHLLYCSWTKRDSLLVSRDSFEHDMAQNKLAMQNAGVVVRKPHFFIPPFEWWNDSISVWSAAQQLRLFSFTPGIRSNADYTWPEMGAAYKTTNWIMNWLKETLTTQPRQFNGSIILVHADTDPRRKDKLYGRLKELIVLLKKAGFSFKRIDQLLKTNHGK